MKKKYYLFQEINVNEVTVREYVPAFLTSAVSHVRKNRGEKLKLHVDYELDGSRGTGNIDYSALFHIGGRSQKRGDVKEMGQNLVQLHSARELLNSSRKRKLEVSLKIPVYGIVTDGQEWVFLEWIGSATSPTVKRLPCKCDLTTDEKKGAREILNRIIDFLLKTT